MMTALQLFLLKLILFCTSINNLIFHNLENKDQNLYLYIQTHKGHVRKLTSLLSCQEFHGKTGSL